MSKNVVIICSNFLPYFPSYGGVARMVNLYKNLKSAGANVTVISAKGEDFGFFGHESELDMNDIYYYNSYVSLNKSKISNVKSSFGKFKSRIVSFFKSHILVPDYTILDIFNAYNEIKKVVANKSVDTLVVSVPKPGLSIVCLLLRHNYGNKIKIVIDYRDGWNIQPIFKMGNYISQRISIALEKLVLSSIDHIVYVSPVVLGLMEGKFDMELRSKSTLIYNGFESTLNPDFCEKNYDPSNVKLVYLGSATDAQNSYRNIDFLIEFVIHNKEFTLDFYGELILERYDIDQIERVRYMGTVATKDLHKIAMKYDWSCIVHTDEESAVEVIPGKFYDSINLKLPALCLVPETCQVSKMVREYGIGICINPTFNSMRKNKENIIDCDIYLKCIDHLQNDKLMFFERKVQMKKYVDLLLQM